MRITEYLLEQQTNERHIMKQTLVNPVRKLSALGLVIGLGLLGVTGCTTGSQYEQSTGEYIDDSGTSSRVRSALGKDPQYKYDDVKVTTFKGTVQLSGFVNSREQKSRAAEITRNVENVREVVNNITVKEFAN